MQSTPFWVLFLIKLMFLSLNNLESIVQTPKFVGIKEKRIY